MALLLAALAGPGDAQQIFGPGEERPPLEEFPDEEPEQPLELPPVPSPPARDPLARGLAVFVRGFSFEGHTIFSERQLAQATAPWTGRYITSEELLDAAAAVAALYTERGYLTSGARVPDQAVEDGIVRIRVVEGRLAAVHVEGVRWFRESYFRDRLRLAGRAPVHAPSLERALRLLQRGRYVARVEARLGPTETLGESILRVRVEERQPYDLTAQTDNEHSPAIGAIGGRVAPRIANLIGHGDELSARFDWTEGLFEWSATYELPLNAYDTKLRLRGQQTEAEVVEAPFDDLGIESSSSTWGVGLAHPLLRDDRDELWLRIAGERSELESCLELLPPDCTPFAFLATQPDPKQVTSVLRLIQDWTRATSHDVLAARSTFSVGLDLLGATTSGRADGQFFAWLGQVQWAHRFPETLRHSELLARLDVQLTDDPLLTLEKFAIGGQRTVRGYRENELVRDNGIVGSLEIRVPLLRTALGRPLAQLVPFADVGRGWDVAGELSDRTLASLGLGVRVFPWPWLSGELFWGERLEHVESPTEHDLQDDGLHFRVTLQPFDALPWTRE